MGWRPEAKRLLLLMTDQPSHLALDSRLAGIVVPHDGLCHLENDVYTGSTRMVRRKSLQSQACKTASREQGRAQLTTMWVAICLSVTHTQKKKKKQGKERQQEREESLGKWQLLCSSEL